MAIGEGGGELVKQLLQDTYDVAYPGVVAIYLTGKPAPYVGPHDVALAIVKAVFKSGYVKNKVMEFVGPGVASMTTDYRNGVDVMTTETTCLSSVWRTDSDTKAFLAQHGQRQGVGLGVAVFVHAEQGAAQPQGERYGSADQKPGNRDLAGGNDRVKH